MSLTPREAITAGAVTSLVAGAAAGLVDGLWSWSASAQFVPDLPGRIRLLVYLAAAYGLAAMVIGAVVTAIAVGYLRLTRLGDLLRHAKAEHDRARARDPRDALGGLALVIAGVPCLAGALVLAYRLWAPWLALRPNRTLAIAAAMGLAIAAVAVGVLVTFAVGRIVEDALRALAERPRLGRALSSPWAPVEAFVAMVAIGAILGISASWETVKQLHLRGPAIAGVAVVFAAGFATSGRRLAAPLARLRTWKLAAIAVGATVALLLSVIVAGGRGGVIKAADAYTGLGGPIAIAVRSVGDLDGDGYSRFLGGGDCDDGDASIHPDATEIPDDGIDQNCVAGDAHPRPRTLDDVGFVAPPPSLPADFDVVLITIDTLRADHLGHYGYARDTSPHLDRLAEESTVFENGWAHAPSTRYSIPAILTGRLPLDVDYDTSIQGWPGLSERATTLAEVLGPRGLRPYAILNYEYFSPNRRMNQGYAKGDYDNTNQSLHDRTREGPAKTTGSSSRQQTDKALAFLADNGDRRYFLWVHYYDPHYEYERHPELGAAGDFGDDEVDLYDGEIRWTDDQIGRLLDALRARPRWDRTVVVVTGDHGEGFGEHDLDFHGYHLYAAQTKVPFVIRVPGQPGRRVEMPVAHVDLMPTLANLAGAAPSTEMMGRSLVDVLSGSPDADQDRVIFQQLSYENHNEHRAAASRQCHVMYSISPITSWSAYRIDRDPLETRDVIDTGECSATRDALAAWHDTAQIPAGAAEALLSGPPDISDPLDVDLGDAVRLLAVELPAQARAGDAFDVTWTFAARGRVGDGWKVFAHFDGPGHFKGDHAPVRPLTWWRRGQHIRYKSSVTVPEGTPAGRYALWAGLWRARGNQRMTARGDVPIDADRAEVGTIEVVP